MNVNLPNVSATNKASTVESASTAATDNPESNGFLETLAGVFTDSQKTEKSVELESESQQKVTTDGQVDGASTDELLTEGEVKATSEETLAEHSLEEAVASHSPTSMQPVTETDVASVKGHEIESAMDEGQQLLGRIQTANQTLNSNSASLEGGKGLPGQVDAITNDVSAAQSGKGEQALSQRPVTELTVQADAKAQDVQQGLAASENEAHSAESVDRGEGISETKANVTAHIDWNSPSTQAAHTQATVNATTNAMVNGERVTQGALSSDETPPILPAMTEAGAVTRISLDALEVIDNKLAQGQPLSQQELEVIDGLRSGSVVADIPEQDLAQLVALPSDVKVALSEQHAAQVNTARQGVSVSMAQQTQYANHSEVKLAAAQVPLNPDKVAVSSTPDALLTANTNPAAQANAELSKTVMNASLTASALKAATDKQDKSEPQHGLAGQIQAAVSHQGVNATQQARIDAAQQAQLPLQLTKELANEQMAEKVQMMMSKNLKNLDIRLDPPELGRMQIRMTMNNDLANVHFTVTNPQAREMIEQTMPRLREMLAQQGMQLAESSVQQQSSGQQQERHTTSEQNGQGALSRGLSQTSDENFDGDVNLDLNVATKRDGISFYA
ncbi:flagellar hook-length control protein FliK [Vibrio alfacsensis]|uniref:flagellar hook-length control protein FliK n=1 Tax=Vibrio alfacsensis TaxID=1074311 RepID=UPI0040698F25